MSRSESILARLLEAEDDGGEHIAKSLFLKAAPDAMLASWKQDNTVNADNAMTADRFYSLKYCMSARGRSMPPQCEARRMGRTKTWKTRPGEFRIPVKYGMYDSFHIDHTNAHEWSVAPIPDHLLPLLKLSRP